MLQQLQKRFGLIEQIPELALGTLLDLRFKGRCFRSDSDKTSAINLLRAETESIHVAKNAEFSQSTSPTVKPSTAKKKRHSLWDSFDNQVGNQRSQLETTAIEAAAVLVSAYLELPCQARTVDPLQWWNNEGGKMFPFLHQLAKKYLIIPATSVPSERVFSTAGQVLTNRRNRLGDASAKQLICFHNNLKI